MSKHLGDYDTSAVIYGKFTTYRPSTGASYTLGGTPALSVYKDNSATQSTTGVTLTADFDSVTGLNHFAIDTSADGSFYAAGSFFDIVITTGTVDSVSVTGSVVGSFTLRKDSSLKPTTAGRTLDVSAGGEAGVDWANVGSPTTTLALTNTTVATTTSVTNRVTANTDQINGTAQTAGDLYPAITGIGTSGGAAINVDANTDNSAGGITGVTSGTTKIGTQTNTYTATSNLNNIYHTITGTATDIDWVYQYLTGGGTSPVSFTWTGYLNGSNDTGNFYAWNHVGAAWELIGVLAGQAGTANVSRTYTLYARHRGTSAAELGKIYIRFVATGMTNPVLATDQLYVSYAVTSRTVGYANGQVSVDTIDGEAGTELFVNGVADNPVLTWADALTIASGLGLHEFKIVNGSTITLSGTSANYVLVGHEWNLALGGQDITSSMFIDAAISGVGTGNDAEFETCVFSNATVDQSSHHHCAYAGTLTFGAAGSYLFYDCSSAIAGGSTPVFAMGGAGTKNIAFRRWSGGMSITGITSSHTISIDAVSGGTITLAGADGTVHIRGMCNVVDNRTGSPTLVTTNNMDARLDSVDTTIAAIKAKTDSLSFTVAGQVDANIQYVNDVQVAGTGAAGDEWSPV